MLFRIQGLDAKLLLIPCYYCPPNPQQTQLHPSRFLSPSLILFIWLIQILVVAHKITDLHGGMWTLSCGMWDLVPWPRIEPGPPALGAWCLGHWSPQKSPYLFLYLCRSLENQEHMPIPPVPIHCRVHSCFLPFHETLFSNSEKHGSCYWLSQP